MTEVTLQAKPVRIKAVKWDGTPESRAEIEAFVSGGEIKFIDFDSKINVDVWNYLEEQWIHVPLGHWVLRGLKDEYYPCEEDALYKKYNVITDESDPVRTDVLIDRLKTIGEALAGEDYIKDSQLITYGNVLRILAEKIQNEGVA